MKLSDISNDINDWFSGTGPLADIVVSSRIRLARNLAGHKFLNSCSDEEKSEILKRLKTVLISLDLGDDVFYFSVDDAPALSRNFLVERHLISRHHAMAKGPRGVVIARREFFTAMVNEEDHLRLQVLKAGCQLSECVEQIDRIDTMIEKQVDYAFSPRLGYLTACPTNIGTGIRASVMLHLPGLVLMNEINPIIKGVNKIGLAVRGLWGEGTDAAGNMFQISNQATLGETEDTIISRLEQIVLEVEEHEKHAKERLLQQKAISLRDHVGRAYGILTHACLLNSKETLDMLSALRLGIELDLLREWSASMIDELFLLIQPGHLQKVEGKIIGAEKRDLARARLIRARLTGKHVECEEQTGRQMPDDRHRRKDGKRQKTDDGTSGF